MKKILLISLLALALLLAACGEQQSPDAKAYQFLSTLLLDDAELQQAILDNFTVIGEGVPAPTEEELASREEREAALTEMLHDRFDGLVSPGLFDRSAQDGSLIKWQSLLAFSGSEAVLNDWSFTDEDSRLVFEATVHCVNGEEETDLPLQGEVVFNEDGLIDSYQLYEDEEGFTGWLRAQEMTVINDKIDEMTEGQ